MSPPHPHRNFNGSEPHLACTREGLPSLWSRRALHAEIWRQSAQADLRRWVSDAMGGWVMCRDLYPADMATKFTVPVLFDKVSSPARSPPPHPPPLRLAWPVAVLLIRVDRKRGYIGVAAERSARYAARKAQCESRRSSRASDSDGGISSASWTVLSPHCQACTVASWGSTWFRSTGVPA